MLAIDTVTVPLITTPLSRTWLSKSPSTSCSTSISSSSSAIGRLVHKMIWRPGTGEVKSETMRSMTLDERRERFLKLFERRVRDEKCGVEHHRASGRDVGVRGLRDR